MIFVFFSLWIIGASSVFSYSEESYYIGDRTDCRYMEYTCEYGYQKFSDTNGCGCTKSYSYNSGSSYNQNNTYTLGSNSYYNTSSSTSINSFYNNSGHSNTSSYIPQNISTSGRHYCENDTRKVCWVPDSNCTGYNCAVLHPRSYDNMCQLEAAWAQYLYDGGCQTYSRNSYDDYRETYHRGSSFSASDEDYLMYLTHDFINDLEDKNNSVSRKIRTIDQVIDKLEDLGRESNNYRTASYKAIRELESYKDALEDEDAYDKIEDIFDRY